MLATADVWRAMYEKPHLEQMTDTFLSAYHPLATMKLSCGVWCPPLLLFANKTCLSVNDSSQHNLCCQNLEAVHFPAGKKKNNPMLIWKRKPGQSCYLTPAEWSGRLVSLRRSSRGQGLDHSSLWAVVSAQDGESKPCGTFWALARRRPGERLSDPRFTPPHPTRLI